MVTDPKITHLRRRIERLEGVAGGSPLRLDDPASLLGSGLSLGDPEIDRRLPGGLAWGSHQIAGAGADPLAARAFTAFLMARWFELRPRATVLVVQEASALREGGGVYGPGLHALGVDPGRMVFVQAPDGAEVLRLLNEALRVRTPEVLIGDLWDGAALADLSVTRRFNLAAAKAHSLAFLTIPHLIATSAALTRWRIASAPGLAPKRRLGAPALNVELVRNRHGQTGRWTLEWSSHDRAFRSAGFGVRCGGDVASTPLAAPVASPALGRSSQAILQDAAVSFGAYRQAG